MAIHIHAEYSKKLGLPQYSSHQFTVSLTSEVADVAQVKAEAERLYAVLQESVDSQIVKAGFAPGIPDSRPANPTTNNNPQPSNDDIWSCSAPQKKLILDIVDRHRLDKNEVESLAKERFGCGVRQLNRLTASGLIDELLERFGESKPKFGNRSAPRRPNGYTRRAA